MKFLGQVNASTSGVITLVTSGTPTAALDDGALALDTSNNILYVRSGGSWVVASGGGGASVTVSDVAPSSPDEGDLWFESDTGDVFVYYDSAWIDIGGSSVANIALQSTAPSSPVNGDLWFDSDTGQLFVWYSDGSSNQWIEVGASSAAASGVDGAVQFASGGTFASDNANLHWDDTNNRLGIGTTSPATNVHISAGSSGVTGQNTAARLIIEDSSSAGIAINTSNTGTGYVRFIDPDNNSVGGMSYAHTDDELKIRTAGSDRVTIDSSGNVGIGTTTPSAELDIKGASNPEIRLQSTDSTDPFLYFGDQVDAVRGGIGMDISANALQLRGYDNSTRLTIDSSGNVGIGTTSPNTDLHVTSSANSLVHIESTDAEALIAFSDSTSTGNWYDRRLGVVGNDMSFWTSNQRRMTIASSGNVGIGTTSPTGDLDINGNSSTLVFTSPSNTNRYRIDANISDAADYGFSIGYWDGAAYQRTLTVDDSGKVGIGTTSPVDLLDVGGTANAGSFRVHATGGGESFRVTGTVVRSTNIVNLTTASAANVFINTANNSMYRSTSSAKYKTDIETLEDEYADIVFELRPVWYRSTTGNDPEEYSYYGLIAEEVAQVDPRLVHFGATADCGCVEDEDGHIEHEQACLTEPESVFYERLVPHLINVVQRQQEQIDALTARIEALGAN